MNPSNTSHQAKRARRLSRVSRVSRVSRLSRLSRLSLLLALLALALLLPAANAFADSGAQVIHDCEFGTGSLAGHSQQAYNQALAELNGSAGEYSDCYNLIRHAQLAALRGRGGGSAGGGGAAAAPTAAQLGAIRALHRNGGRPVLVGGRVVRPGAIHASVASVARTLPTPLLATLIALVAAAALGGAGAIRNRVRARRR